MASKAVVQVILVERGDGDELTRCRGDKAGMRPKLGRPSPSYTFTNEVRHLPYVYCDQNYRLFSLLICYNKEDVTGVVIFVSFPNKGPLACSVNLVFIYSCSKVYVISTH